MKQDSQDQSPMSQLEKLAPQHPPTHPPINPNKSLSRSSQRLDLNPQAPINLQLVRQRGPRLVIDHMILEDFKSYAGKQKIGLFHTNFTSIVGPNGSGKSNLIESMLFIFGFSASWMRLSKLNQLIHNSSTAQNISKAAVEVHFKKLQEVSEGNYVQIPGSGFMIRRTVNQASVSKYYMNGQESTQAEVKQRLKSQGIDLGNNRFLILQGEVQQISQMKQKSGDPDKPGLLQYLQEIIGSSKFIQQIEQCAGEYALAQEQKHEKGQMMRLVQNQLKSMSKAKDQAVSYVKRQKKIYQLQNVYSQVQVHTAQQKTQRLRQQLKVLQQNKERIIAEQRQKLKKQAQRIKQIKKNKATIQQMQGNMSKLQEQCDKLGVQDKHCTQEIVFKSEDMVKWQRKGAEAQKQMNRIINKCDQIRDTMPEKKKTLEAKQGQMEKMKNELAVHDKPALREHIKQCQNQVNQHEIAINALNSKLQGLNSRKQKAEMGLGELQAKNEQYQQRRAEQTETRNKIEKASGVATRMIQQKTRKVRQLQGRREQIRGQLRRVQGMLRQQMDNNQQKGNMNNMFKQIMNQGFPGVLGRLGDLGKVSKQYDQIITTCCNRLDNIVVTDFKTANMVIDFIKKRRLGRATCIILELIKQSKQYMDRPFQAPPQTVRLFDMIKVSSQQARLAFYFALNDTLYCQNSDMGMKYSYDNERRRRVMSRSQRGGYIIFQINGLMVGNAARRGGFDVKAGGKDKQGRAQTDQLQKQKQSYMRQLEGIQREIKSQEDELNTARQDIQHMKRQIGSIEQNVRDLNQEIKELQKNISQFSQRGKDNGDRNGEIVALQNQIKSRAAKKAQVQAKLKQLQDQQKKGQTAQIAQLRLNYKQQRLQLTQQQKQFQKQRALLQSSLRRMQQLNKTKTQSTKRIQTIKRQIDKMKRRQVELEDIMSGHIGKMAAFQQKVVECRKREGELKMILEEDDKDVKESKLKIDKVRKEVQMCQEAYKGGLDQLKSAQAEVIRNRKKYQQLCQGFEFIDRIQQVQRMIIGQTQQKMNQRLNTSVLQNSILNSSLDTSRNDIFQVDVLMRYSPNDTMRPDQLEHYALFKDKIKALIATDTSALARLEGSNLQVINEYRIKYGQYKQRLGDFQKVRDKQAQLKMHMDQLKAQRLQLFRQGFGIINSKLKQVYQHLTRGGDAQMQLIDALDPFSDGVNFSVRPPKKSWKQVNKLSGGQKTLSSLSLIFALHYFKPTPLYFMDEIDAALDFKNVGIVADYLKKRTKDAQFIIISLRNNMFDLADKLIGVYKTSDKTGTVNFQPAKMLKMREEQKENMKSRGN